MNKIIPCLDGAGYDECTAKLYSDVCRCAHGDVIRCPANKIAGAPSGASRSFDYGDDGITWLRDSLANRIPAAAPVNSDQRWQHSWACLWWSGLLMAWVSVQQRLPRTFTWVWVITDTGEQTTAYVKSDGEWYINCVTAYAPQALLCCDGGMTDVIGSQLVIHRDGDSLAVHTRC